MWCGPTSCIPKSNKWAVLTVCTALSGSSPSHSLKRTRYQQAADSSQFLTAPYKQNLYKVIAEFATVVLFECCLAGPITYQCYSYSRLPKVSKISTLPEYFTSILITGNNIQTRTSYSLTSSSQSSLRGRRNVAWSGKSANR